MTSVRERFVELNDLTDSVLDAMTDGESDPVALTFLLRRYRATGRDDLTEILGPALARAVEASRRAATCDAQSSWLEAFITAATLSSDARMEATVAELVAALRGQWRRSSDVADLLLSIDACLQATTVFESHELVRDAIDELERVVGGTYRPGQGIAGTLGDADGSARRLPEQIRGASVLVTACVGTGRLPYGMLAEELIQFAHRTFWDPEAEAFVDRQAAGEGFAVNCAAARVLCRLARLLEDEDYRRGAVVVVEADYRHDASRILASQLPAARANAAGAAPYALALDDWLSLR